MVPEGSCAEIEQKGNDRLLQAAISTSRGRVYEVYVHTFIVKKTFIQV